MVRFAWLVVLAGCPAQHKPFPCTSSTVRPDVAKAVTGSVKIQHGTIAASYELPDVAASVATAGGATLFDGGGTDFGYGFNLFPKTENGLFMIYAQLGDIRALPAGTHPISKLELQYHPGCKRKNPDWCPYMCKVTGLAGEIEIVEAEGGIAPFPDAVTPEFHRKIRVRARAQDVVGKLETHVSDPGPKLTCFPVGYDIDVTVVIGRRDFTSRTGTCGGG
jgi:hypothetical protein